MPSFFRIPKRANPDRRMEAPVARILDERWAPVSGRAGPEECVAVSELASDGDSEQEVPNEDTTDSEELVTAEKLDA